ncbi:MAG: TlpA family protein disulfide reductase [Acidimicrobiales bacterium]
MIAIVGVAAFAGGSGGGSRRSGDVTSATGFDLPALDGRGRVRLADFRGRPLVVNLFASWCTVCRDELPIFVRSARQLQGRVAFVGIDSQETGNGRAMAREFGLADAGFVLGRDVAGDQKSGLHDSLGARGMPVTAFYDKDGRLVHVERQGLIGSALPDRLHELFGV